MHYVLLNRRNGELLILSHDDYVYNLYLNDNDMDNNPAFTHLAIFAASYDECLEFCEKRIGYKE